MSSPLVADAVEDENAGDTLELQEVQGPCPYFWVIEGSDPCCHTIVIGELDLQPSPSSSSPCLDRFSFWVVDHFPTSLPPSLYRLTQLIWFSNEATLPSLLLLPSSSRLKHRVPLSSKESNSPIPPPLPLYLSCSTQPIPFSSNEVGIPFLPSPLFPSPLHHFAPFDPLENKFLLLVLPATSFLQRRSFRLSFLRYAFP